MHEIKQTMNWCGGGVVVGFGSGVYICNVWQYCRQLNTIELDCLLCDSANE